MDGAATKIGITNAEGYFFPGVGLINDPGELGPDDVTTTLNATTCQLRAILSGYVSSIAAVPRYNPMFAPNKNVVRITLHKAQQTEGYMVSATSGLAPEGARKAFEDGMDSMKDKHWKDAEKSFQEAVKVYGRYAEAWYQLGKAYRELERPEDARAAFLKSVEADPRYVSPYEELYQLAFERDDMEDLLDKTETLIRLDPFQFPGAYYFSAVANLQLKHYAAGEERIRTAIADDPDYKQPMAYYVLGFLLANQGKTAEALGAFDIFLALQPEGDASKQARAAMDTLQERIHVQKPERTREVAVEGSTNEK